MDRKLTFTLDRDPVNFTPDGKVSVLDAIRALGDTERPGVLWEELKTEHPDIASLCEEFSFQEDSPEPVVDSDGWEKIQVLLFEYVLEEMLAAS